jgi:hypothetical protein
VITYDPLQNEESNIKQLVEELNRQYTAVAGQKALKTSAYGETTVSVPQGGNDIVVFNHALGYAPMFLLFQGSVKNILNQLPILDAVVLFGVFHFSGGVLASCDSNNVYINWKDTAPAPTQTITYVVFQNPIQPSV